MKINFYFVSNKLFVILLISVPIFNCEIDPKKYTADPVVHRFRKCPRLLLFNDNEEFKSMLMGDGEIKLCSKLKVDMSNWPALTPRASKIIGNGKNSTIEIYPDKSGSIRLFEKLENVELININVEIKSPDNNNDIYINNGLVKEIRNSIIRGFHINLNNKMYITITQKEMGLISESIYNSILIDVGIIFNDIRLILLKNEEFSLISAEVINERTATYEGIFIKGKMLNIDSQIQIIKSGLLFGSVKNVNFNYVVIDIQSINLEMKIQSYYSLFAYTTQNDIIINYMSIIIMNQLSYSDTSYISGSNYLSCLFDNIPMDVKISLNYCIIDIIFDEIKVEIYSQEPKVHHERGFYFSGISRIANENSKVIMEYLIIRLYFNKEFISNSRNENYNTHSCKFYCIHTSIPSASILFVSSSGFFTVKNSYFYINKESVEVNSMNITNDINNNNKVNNVFDHSFITDGYNIVLKKYNLISGPSDSIYNNMKSLGYKISDSVIYYPHLPYIDYTNAEINYNMYIEKLPRYHCYCNICEPINTFIPTSSIDNNGGGGSNNNNNNGGNNNNNKKKKKEDNTNTILFYCLIGLISCIVVSLIAWVIIILIARSRVKTAKVADYMKVKKNSLRDNKDTEESVSEKKEDDKKSPFYYS